MSYPQGYLYQPPGSLALYSCPAYGASALAAPRNEDLARSSSGSAFSPYPGSAAFSASASAGFSSPLSYSTDPTTGFPSYMVKYLIYTCMRLYDKVTKQDKCVGELKSVSAQCLAVFHWRTARLQSVQVYSVFVMIHSSVNACGTLLLSARLLYVHMKWPTRRGLTVKSLTSLA